MNTYSFYTKVIFQKIFWFIFGTGLVFCVYMYNINPTFFSIIGIFNLIIIVLSQKTEIILTHNSLQIINHRLLPFTKTKYDYPFSSIENLRFEKKSMSVNIMAYIISVIAGGHASLGTRNELLLKVKNYKEKELAVGSKVKEAEILIKKYKEITAPNKIKK